MTAIDSQRGVFVEECSSNTLLAPLYGYAQKRSGRTRRSPQMEQEHDASLKHRQGAGCPGVFGSGGFDETEGFRDLSWGRSVPHAKEGQVMVMDHLSFHKGGSWCLSSRRDASSPSRRPIP